MAHLKMSFDPFIFHIHINDESIIVFNNFISTKQNSKSFN